MKKQKDIIMLTIDSSTTKTGIAVFVNGKYTTVHLINLEEYKTMDERFCIMGKEIIKILGKYNPQIIYIEETVVVRNPATQRFLTRLQGVIYGWAIMNNCEISTVRPSEWRKALNFNQGKNIKRENLKKQAIDYINDHYKILVSDDEAEAICIGLYALNLFNIAY